MPLLITKALLNFEPTALQTVTGGTTLSAAAGVGIIRVTSASAVTVYMSSGAYPGQQVIVRNEGAYPLTFGGGNIGATGGRFLLPGTQRRFGYSSAITGTQWVNASGFQSP